MSVGGDLDTYRIVGRGSSSGPLHGAMLRLTGPSVVIGGSLYPYVPLHYTKWGKYFHIVGFGYMMQDVGTTAGTVTVSLVTCSAASSMTSAHTAVSSSTVALTGADRQGAYITRETPFTLPEFNENGAPSFWVSGADEVVRIYTSGMATDGSASGYGYLDVVPYGHFNVEPAND